MIDGSINPDEDTWQSRERRNQRQQLNKYLASLFGIRNGSDDKQG